MTFGFEVRKLPSWVLGVIDLLILNPHLWGFPKFLGFYPPKKLPYKHPCLFKRTQIFTLGQWQWKMRLAGFKSIFQPWRGEEIMCQKCPSNVGSLAENTTSNVAYHMTILRQKSGRNSFQKPLLWREACLTENQLVCGAIIMVMWKITEEKQLYYTSLGGSC